MILPYPTKFPEVFKVNGRDSLPQSRGKTCWTSATQQGHKKAWGPFYFEGEKIILGDSLSPMQGLLEKTAMTILESTRKEAALHSFAS